jgi:hypothetical protein
MSHHYYLSTCLTYQPHPSTLNLLSHTALSGHLTQPALNAHQGAGDKEHTLYESYTISLQTPKTHFRCLPRQKPQRKFWLFSLNSHPKAKYCCDVLLQNDVFKRFSWI